MGEEEKERRKDTLVCECTMVDSCATNNVKYTKKVMRALILGLYPARFSEYLLNMHLLLLLIDAIIIAALTAVNIYTSALSTINF